MSDDPLSFESAGETAAFALTVALAAPLVWPTDAHVAGCMAKWLRASGNAHSADTQLLAKLIAERDVRGELALLGLQAREWDALLSRHFTRAAVPASAVTTHANAHADFVRSLHALLLTHANPAVDPDDARDLATIIAHACLRPDHLWRDLGLAGRDEVTWMLTRYFPTLVALNVANLRWKKFLAAQRALSLGLAPGPAPGCPGCEDYAHCFPLQRH